MEDELELIQSIFTEDNLLSYLFSYFGNYFINLNNLNRVLSKTGRNGFDEINLELCQLCLDYIDSPGISIIDLIIITLEIALESINFRRELSEVISLQFFNNYRLRIMFREFDENTTFDHMDIVTDGEINPKSIKSIIIEGTLWIRVLKSYVNSNADQIPYWGKMRIHSYEVEKLFKEFESQKDEPRLGLIRYESGILGTIKYLWF